MICMDPSVRYTIGPRFDQHITHVLRDRDIKRYIKEGRLSGNLDAFKRRKKLTVQPSALQRLRALLEV